MKERMTVLRNSLLRLALVSTLLVLGACSLMAPPRPTERAAVPTAAPKPVEAPRPAAPTPLPPAVTPPATAPTPPSTPPPAAREYHLSAAAQSLINQAHAQMSRGELPGASTTLDRAIRIEPKNPLVWIEVARLRLAEGDGRQAESCARKALALGSLDPATRAKAGHALADALRTQHRETEAHELEQQPWMN
jgi:Tfp pilus assembly protein PilF